MKRFLPYIGPLIGLTGVSLALYFHAQSIQERVPTFYVGPQRAVIVDARGPTSSDLQVLYRGKPVSTSVTAVTAYVWNAGRLPIRASDVLGDPVSFELAPGAEILEARLLKSSRPVVRFAIGAVSDKAKNSLPVTFDILEKDDGAAVQLIYSGDPNARVSVVGTIVGAGSPRLLRVGEGRFFKSPSPKALRRGAKVVNWLFGVMGLALAIWGGIRLYQRRRAGEPVGSAPVVVLVGIVYAALGIYALHNGYAAESPVPPNISTES